MKRTLLAAVLSLMATACERAEMAAEAPALYEIAPRPAPAADAAAGGASAKEAAAPPRAPMAIPMLAYSYGYEIETPARNVRELMKAHEAACLAAGVSVCQMVNQSVRSSGKDRLAGSLELRATPAWLARFRAGLADQARAAGGRVIGERTDSEDLTRQIIDTEAALRAKTTLRDRLQSILASRPGKVSELLEVERELARVQQEIDAAQSELNVMKTRVATSELRLNYTSAGTLAPEGVWSPLARAFADFLGIIAMTLGLMVRTVAALLPWALLVGGLVWLFRKRLKWPFRRKAKAAAERG